jgi:hypothetical protein
MSNRILRIYTVVDVMGGVIAGAKSFVSLKEAQAILKRTRGARNLDQDDVQIVTDDLTLSALAVKSRSTRRRQQRKA